MTILIILSYKHHCHNVNRNNSQPLYPNGLQSMMPMQYNWLESFRTTFFAPQCTLCNAPVTHDIDLCTPCQNDLPWQQNGCRYCGKTLPPETRASCCSLCVSSPRFDAACAAFRYELPVDQLIIRLKFHNGFSHARTLATLLATRVTQTAVPMPDYIVPVPLHSRRYRQRGYNQATLLAQHLSRQLALPVRHNLATRHRHTASQHKLPAEERASNMRNAFSVRRNCRGDHIAIVDDVVTTGHTAAALAGVLKHHGAPIVQLWCVAHA